MATKIIAVAIPQKAYETMTHIVDEGGANSLSDLGKIAIIEYLNKYKKNVL